MARIAVWIVTVCLTACAERPQAPLTGYLYFGSGKYLGRLDLSTGNSTPVTVFGDLDIEQLSLLDGNELLLSVVTSRLGRRQSRVLRFDPASSRLSVFLMGSAAQYLPAADTVLYDDGVRLVAVPRRRLRSDGAVLRADSAGNSTLAIAVADDDVLFLRDQDSNSIQRFDLDSGTTRTLTRLSELCVLDGALWVESRDQLLCRALPSATAAPRYRWVSLNGELAAELPLPAGRRFRALAYLPDRQLLILNETKPGWFAARPRYPVWAYNERDGTLQRIAGNQYLGTSVVYTRGWR
jgi:hypothetical protein